MIIGFIILFLEVNTLNKGDAANLKCAECTWATDPRQCNVTKTCTDSRKLCIVVETVTSSTYQTGYRQGCTLPETCYNIDALGFGRKRSLRHACCHGNLCNKEYPSMIINTVHSPSTQSIISQVCPHDSISRHHEPDGKHFHFFACNETWRNALYSCGSNRHLAMGTGSTMHTILTVIRSEFNYSGPVWIGGYSKMTDHTWVWLDGSPIDLNDHFWHQGEPNRFLTPDTTDVQEDCLAIVNRKWQSRSCFEKHPFVCI